MQGLDIFPRQTRKEFITQLLDLDNFNDLVNELMTRKVMTARACSNYLMGIRHPLVRFMSKRQVTTNVLNAIRQNKQIVEYKTESKVKKYGSKELYRCMRY